MGNGTSFGIWLQVIIVAAAALGVGCRQETPLAPTTAAKVAEIAVVNPARGFVDSIALSPDASRPMGRGLALRFDRSGERLGVICEREVLLLDVAMRLETTRGSNPHRQVLTAFDLAANGAKLLTAGTRER